MEMIARRRIANRKSGSHMIVLPPYFLEAMNGMDCDEVILTAKDQDHIVIELVRKDAEN